MESRAVQFLILLILYQVSSVALLHIHNIREAKKPRNSTNNSGPHTTSDSDLGLERHNNNHKFLKDDDDATNNNDDNNDNDSLDDELDSMFEDDEFFNPGAAGASENNSGHHSSSNRHKVSTSSTTPSTTSTTTIAPAGDSSIVAEALERLGLANLTIADSSSSSSSSGGGTTDCRRIGPVGEAAEKLDEIEKWINGIIGLTTTQSAIYPVLMILVAGVTGIFWSVVFVYIYTKFFRPNSKLGGGGGNGSGSGGSNGDSSSFGFFDDLLDKLPFKKDKKKANKYNTQPIYGVYGQQQQRRTNSDSAAWDWDWDMLTTMASSGVSKLIELYEGENGGGND